MDGHLLKRAFQLDIEEISLLASACRTAPPGVCNALLGIIMSEVREASFWNALHACCDGGKMPPCKDPDGMYPYPGGYYPYQEKGGPGKQ